MKTFKMLQIAAVIFGLSVLIGCGNSDEIISSGSPGISPGTDKRILETEENVPRPVPVIPTYRTQLKLKPNSSQTFEFSNTGFYKFTSIDVSSIGPSADRTVQDCSNISIYGDSKNDQYISCHSGGFDFKKITIENTSSKDLELDVSIIGLKWNKTVKDSD